MFAWYWLADLCEDKRIPFVLGHALAMKHIHGGKAKSDKLDAGKLANMLRGGIFPLAYVYPAINETATCCVAASSSSGNAPNSSPISSKPTASLICHRSTRS